LKKEKRKKEIKKTRKEESFKPISEQKFEELLSDSKKINLLLEEEINEILPGSAVLFMIESNDYTSFRDSLLKKISSKPAVYITINKPADFLKKKMNELNVSPEKVFFIDMITDLTSKPEKKEGGVSFIGAPSELVESMLEVDNALNKSEKKFVVLDSVSSLLVYNEEKATERFVHALISKINRFNSIGLLLAVDSDEYADQLKSLEQFCDKIIDVKI
jgi:KaiC/GvpD/RAD55 family RecA-like ATPase